MGDKSLREFATDIKQHIQDGRSNEAIPMAQHLLRHYPRYLRGYRLLAEAALEQGNYKDAIEIFRRVLSADPEDLTAHAGLAATYAEEGEMDESLWHMMRAFEVEPRMQEVRYQLRYLYERRDGRAPGRLHLNGPALARVYLREGLYDRAIEELSGALASEPERIDLLTSLAEAQWRGGQRQQAVETARRVLMELPYSLKANLILAEFYTEAGDDESASPFLRVVQQLDPENDVAASLFGESAAFPLTQLFIEPMEVATGAAAPLGDEETRLPDWLADLSLFTGSEPEEEHVDWDAIIAHETDWRTLLAHSTRDALATFQPDWRVELRHATRRALPRSAPRARPAAAAPRPTPAPQPVASRPAPAPDWRAALAQETRSALASHSPAPVPTPETTALPDWRAALTQETRSALASQPPATAPAPETSALPDWALDLHAATEQLLQEPVAAPSPQPEHPAATEPWQEQLRAATEQTLAAPPPWIVSLRAESEVALIEAPAVGEALPDRLETRPLRGGRRWIEQLRVDTELEIAQARRRTAELRRQDAPVPAPEEEGSTEDATDVIEWAQELVETLKSEAGEVLAEAASQEGLWVDELRGATLAQMEAREAKSDGAALPGQLAARAGDLMERAHTVAESLKERASELLHRRRQEDDWVATLRADTQAQLPGSNGGTTSIGKRIAHGAEGLAERAGTLKEKATDSLSSLIERVSPAEDEPEKEALEALGEIATIPTVETILDEAPEAVEEERADAPDTTPAPEDELGRARAAWEAEQPKEAFAIYQRLFYEGGAPDEALSAALAEWTARGEAPALAYQLLGDLYRRMGRMQEAVVQYREAINRM